MIVVRQGMMEVSCKNDQRTFILKTDIMNVGSRPDQKLIFERCLDNIYKKVGQKLSSYSSDASCRDMNTRR